MELLNSLLVVSPYVLGSLLGIFVATYLVARFLHGKYVEQSDTVKKTPLSPFVTKVSMKGPVGVESIELSVLPLNSPKPMELSLINIHQDSGHVFVLSQSEKSSSCRLDLFSPIDVKWSKCPSLPFSIVGACSVILLDILLVFTSPNESPNGQLFIYDIKMKSWSEYDPDCECSQSQCPSNRIGATFFPINESSALFYGGISTNDGSILCDIWKLSIEIDTDSMTQTIKWTLISDVVADLNNHSARAFHSSWIQNDQMFVCGGCSSLSSIATSSMSCNSHNQDDFSSDEDFSTNPSLLNVYDMLSNQWSTRLLKGIGPKKVSSCHPIADSHRVVVLAKESNSNELFNQIFLLDLDLNEWFPLSIDWKGDWSYLAKSRSQYGADLDQATNILYIFGGTDNQGSPQEGLLLLDCSPFSDPSSDSTLSTQPSSLKSSSTIPQENPIIKNPRFVEQEENSFHTIQNEWTNTTSSFSSSSSSTTTATSSSSTTRSLMTQRIGNELIQGCL